MSHQPPLFEKKTLEAHYCLSSVAKLGLTKAGYLPERMDGAKNSRRGVRFSKEESVRSQRWREGRKETSLAVRS